MSYERPAALTWEEARFGGVIRQAFDYSCGFASLVTMLRYHFDERDINEKELLVEFLDWLPSDEERVAVALEGATLEQIAEFSDDRLGELTSTKRDFDSWLFNDTTSEEVIFTAAKTRPVLVYVEPQGYRHFAVLRGVVGGAVFLADPSRGNIRLDIVEFKKEWIGHWALFLERPGFVPQGDILSVVGLDGREPVLDELKRSMIFGE